MKNSPKGTGKESRERADERAPGTSGKGAGGQGLGEKGAAPRAQSSFDWWRENIEALLVAVILALIIRHFAVEAFEIPTGSMANTLYGIHAWLDCPNCPTRFNLALQSDSSTGNINVRYEDLLVYKGECPQCGLKLNARNRFGSLLNAPSDEVSCSSCRHVFRGDPASFKRVKAVLKPCRCRICHHVFEGVIENDNVTGGHKILVNKFAYCVGKPQRFDVIVFGFDQWKNYIKRLIGLPGERINVWDGDVYVNGKIVRKPEHAYVQNVLWTQIADSDVAEKGLNPVPAWAEVAPEAARRGLAPQKNAQWDATVKRWSLNAAGDVAIIAYQRRFDNYYNYNILYHGPDGFPSFMQEIDGKSRQYPEQVGDKKVEFSVSVVSAKPQTGNGPFSGSWVGAEIQDGLFTFQLRIPVGTPSDAAPAVIERISPMPVGAESLRVAAAAALQVGTEAKIEFENVDDRVAARLNGTEIFHIDYTSLPEGATFQNPPEPPSRMWDAHRLRLIVCGAQANLRAIKVFRDMFYIAQTNNRLWTGITLGEGQYFAMGDNAPSSSDGRYWGFIPEKNLMGKALLVFWPAWPWNPQCKFIR